MRAPQINSRTPQKGDFKMFFRIVRALTNRIIRVYEMYACKKINMIYIISSSGKYVYVPSGMLYLPSGFG